MSCCIQLNTKNPTWHNDISVQWKMWTHVDLVRWWCSCCSTAVGKGSNIHQSFLLLVCVCVCVYVSACCWVQPSECAFLCSHSHIQLPHVSLSHHYACVELVEALHGAITEAVAQVFLDKVGMVQDVISHQRFLPLKRRRDKMGNDENKDMKGGKGRKEGHY